MADKKISELDAVGSAADTDVVPVVQSGSTKRATLAQLLGVTHQHAAGDVDSGEFADARVSESSVTQHANEEFIEAAWTDTVVVTGDNSTRATRATAVQSAITEAAGASKVFVFVPHNFLNYDASAVTFDNSVRMVREGQVADVYDVEAYGAASGASDNSAAIQAANDAAEADGGGVVVYKDLYPVTSTITTDAPGVTHRGLKGEQSGVSGSGFNLMHWDTISPGVTNGGERVAAEHFVIRDDTGSTSTVGLKITDTAQFRVANSLIRGTGQQGIGLDLHGALTGYMPGTSVTQWNDGVSLDDVSGSLPKSNSNTLVGMRLRLNTNGLHAVADGVGEAQVLNAVVEANEVGCLLKSGSWFLGFNHFEQTEGATPTDVQADGSGVKVFSCGNAYRSGGDRLVVLDNGATLRSVGDDLPGNVTLAAGTTMVVRDDISGGSAPADVGSGELRIFSDTNITGTTSTFFELRGFLGWKFKQGSEGLQLIPGTGGTNRTELDTLNARDLELQRNSAGRVLLANGGGDVYAALGGGEVRCDSASAVRLPSYAVSALPVGAEGQMAYASDGRKNGETTGNGTGVQVFFDGTDWIAVDTGQAVAA